MPTGWLIPGLRQAWEAVSWMECDLEAEHWPFRFAADGWGQSTWQRGVHGRRERPATSCQRNVIEGSVLCTLPGSVFGGTVQTTEFHLSSALGILEGTHQVADPRPPA